MTVLGFCHSPVDFTLTSSPISAHSRTLPYVLMNEYYDDNENDKLRQLAQIRFSFSDERYQLISLPISMFGQTVLTMFGQTALTMFHRLCSDLLIWTMYRLVMGSFSTWCCKLGILSLTMSG